MYIYDNIHNWYSDKQSQIIWLNAAPSYSLSSDTSELIPVALTRVRMLFLRLLTTHSCQQECRFLGWKATPKIVECWGTAPLWLGHCWPLAIHPSPKCVTPPNLVIRGQTVWQEICENTFSAGAKYTGVEKIAIFDWKHCLARKRHEIGS